MSRIWILTGSPENHAATAARGFEGDRPQGAQSPGKVDAYPWRFAASPEAVLTEEEWVPAESLADQLEHVAKWPAEHWTLAFQGQIRPVSEQDATVLMQRLGVGTPAAR